MREPLFGAHESAAGGLSEALRRGHEIACRALQVFVKSPSQWRARDLVAAEVGEFRADRAAAPLGPIVAHAAYLINLAAPDPEILGRSRAALADELDRCERLGLEALVVHPGAHRGTGVDVGVRAVAASLDAILAGRTPGPTRILLELTAGAGSVLGSRIEQLRAMRDGARNGESVGFCIDTCHAFAAGYPIAERAGYEAFVAEIDRLLGLDAIGCLHLNDSVGALGSRKDRHANLGEGLIGREPFGWIARDPRWDGVPLLLETPLGDDERGHARDLAVLRDLANEGATNRRGSSTGRSRGRSPSGGR